MKHSLLRTLGILLISALVLPLSYLVEWLSILVDKLFNILEDLQ
jgi:hypothetical protein